MVKWEGQKGENGRMETWLWVFALVVVCVSLVGSVAVLRWYLRKKRPVKRSGGGAPRGWKTMAVAWPVLCAGFVGIIFGQAARGVEGRLALDAFFVGMPLIFFGIGMKMRRRLLEERRDATVPVTAVVVSEGRRVHAGRSNYFPEYEFQAEGRSCHVVSRGSCSAGCVREGEQVELFYAPEHPEVFYVPAVQRHQGRWAGLLCGVGIAFPLVGLLAPVLRVLTGFLE